MKRDKRTIDEILREYLTSASPEEVESAGAAVLLRLQEEMEHGIEKFRYPEPEIKLRPDEQFTLAAIALLRGQGNLFELIDKTQELAGRPLSTTSIALALRRLTQLELVEERRGPTAGFVRITPRGERALEAAGIPAEERALGHLEDLI